MRKSFLWRLIPACLIVLSLVVPCPIFSQEADSGLQESTLKERPMHSDYKKIDTWDVIEVTGLSAKRLYEKYKAHVIIVPEARRIYILRIEA